MRRYLFIILLFHCANLFGQVDLSKGLIAHYSFSGNADDKSGSNLHGTTIGNIKLTEDRYGNANQAYQFDGIDDAIIVKDKGALSTAAFSICYYFKTEASKLQVCIGKINYEDGNGATYNSGFSSANAFFGTMQSLNNCFIQVPTTFVYTIYSPQTINPGQWYCVVNTFENGHEKLYLDGILVKESLLPFSNATYCTNTDFLIGTWWKGDPNKFKGAMDEVRYYNRALNPQEVQQLCNPVDSIIINQYIPVTNLDICTNTVTVSDASEFKAGDTVLVIQMQGAVIDSSNTPSFGTIKDYQNSGNYEVHVINKKSGNVLTFLNKIERSYDAKTGSVQLVRIPYYPGDVTFPSPLTCKPWDGKTGGVLALISGKHVNMQADFDVSGKGFPHGNPMNNTAQTFNQAGWYLDASGNNGAEKGRSIYQLSKNRSYGRGAPANGGGGGNAHNAGGGGGANGGAGGDGGRQWEINNILSENIGGKGGHPLTNGPSLNRLFMGGSGGMGQGNDFDEYPAGNGGGIVFISAASLEANGHGIFANGQNATDAPTPEECRDALSGGGGGGTILISTSALDQIKLEAKGGKGADQIGNLERHGSGGGGGGGFIGISQATIPGQYAMNVTGGKNGVNVNHSNDPYGATAGKKGIVQSNFKPFTSAAKFVKNIDSVKIREAVSDCNTFEFEGVAFTQNTPPVSWNWFFGDGGTAEAKDVTYTYTTSQNMATRLVISDQNGCRDSVTITSKLGSIPLTISNDTTVCTGETLSLFADGADNYSWTPVAGLSDAKSSNPVVIIGQTTTFTATGTNKVGCKGTKSVTVTAHPKPVVRISPDTVICKSASVQLLASGGSTYEWWPATNLTNSHISSPVASPTSDMKYVVTVTDLNKCTLKDSVTVRIHPAAVFSISGDTAVCKNQPVTLHASGGSSYSWQPASGLDNISSANPGVVASNTTRYTVIIKEDRCNESATLSATVRVMPLPVVKATKTGDVDCSFPTVQLKATGAGSYNWSPITGLSDASSSNPSATPVSNIVYTVTGKDVNGCQNSDSVSVKVVNTSKVIYDLPNTFTPNGDGINDCFGIGHWGEVKELNFSVYNKWGERVFFSSNSKQCWDGRYKGHQQSSNVFVYLIKAKTACGTIERKGTVLLLK